MKKSLLVLAVAAAVPVLAQAQTNVTLYGRVDAAVGSESRGGGAGSAVSLLSGVQSSNRWGVRGSEDLGGGLKAVFNLEGGFDADVGRGQSATQTSGISNGSGGYAPGTAVANTNGALDFRRRSVVGLEGGFGSLLFGRDYDPMFRVLLGSDNLGLGHYANVHTIFGANSLYNGQRTYGVRIDNGIHYVSPSLGGFVVRGAYGFSENFNATNGSLATVIPAPGTVAASGYTKSTGRAVSLAAEYAAGPLYVGLAYRANSVASGPTAAVPVALAANPLAIPAFGFQSGTDKFISLGARYNFGAFAVNAGGGKANLANNVGTPYTAATAGNYAGAPGGYQYANPGALDTKAFWVGGDAQVGPGRLHVQVGSIKPTLISKSTTLGVTYNYPLSKRTNAYATFGAVKNGVTSGVGLGTSSTAVIPGAAGADPRGIAFGVGHNF
jgi:predicted porin